MTGPLRDIKVFKEVWIEWGALQWPWGGIIQIDFNHGRSEISSIGLNRSNNFPNTIKYYSPIP